MLILEASNLSVPPPYQKWVQVKVADSGKAVLTLGPREATGIDRQADQQTTISQQTIRVLLERIEKSHFSNAPTEEVGGIELMLSADTDKLKKTIYTNFYQGAGYELFFGIIQSIHAKWEKSILEYLQT